MRIVLPSNASSKLYPSNTLAQYTIQLPQPLDLSTGHWEIGLAEIQFLKSWYNVKNASLSITKITSENETETVQIKLDDGFYETHASLINHINENIKCVAGKEVSNLVRFDYNDITRKCVVKIVFVNHLTLMVACNDNLTEILNVKDLKLNRQSKCKEDPDTGQKFVDLVGTNPIRLQSIFNLMIYTDVAASGIVGDIEAPLLRSIPVKEGHWKYQCTSVNKIQYVPLSQKEIRYISLYIYTDYGEPVPFTDGKTIITLDLRRAKPLHTY